MNIQHFEIWFKINDLQQKHGTIIDGFYDSLLQVMEDETKKIYIVNPKKIKINL